MISTQESMMEPRSTRSTTPLSQLSQLGGALPAKATAAAAAATTTTTTTKPACDRRFIFVTTVWTILAVQLLVAASLFATGHHAGSVVLLVCGIVVFATLLLPLLEYTADADATKTKKYVAPTHGEAANRTSKNKSSSSSSSSDFSEGGTGNGTPAVSRRASTDSFNGDKAKKTAAAAEAGETRTGIIVSHKDSFGFMRDSVEGTPDWFFHISELLNCDVSQYPLGTPVDFVVGKDAITGRALATKLRRTGDPALGAETASQRKPVLPAEVGPAVPVLQQHAPGSDRWNRWGDEPVVGHQGNGSSCRSWRRQATVDRKDPEASLRGGGPAVGSTYVPFHLRSQRAAPQW